MTLNQFAQAATLTSLLSITLFAPASAGVVFSESFEAPVVSGFDDNTVTSNNKWIGATNGFGATNRGLYNESVTWPATAPFTTPYGAQAYYLNYTNSALTTSVGATGQTLIAGVPYKVSFNVGVVSGTGTYRVELVAFTTAHDNAARADGQGTRVGAILATSTGTVSTKTMAATGQLLFTPAAGNAHLGKDLGIRLVKDADSVLYDNIRLVTGHDMNPTPASGLTIAGGNVSLSWTNMPPTSGTDVAVDVWFGTNPAALTKVVNGTLNTTSTIVSAPSAATYYWRVDSYLDGNPAGTPVTGDLFNFVITDTDNDGFPDSYELANTTPASNTALNPGDDLEPDGLTNLQEYQFNTLPRDNDTDDDTLLDGPEINGAAPRPATNPRIADTDGDGLSDGIENNSGTWVSTANPGTNPTDPDWDNDGLSDKIETKTGTYVSRTADSGTDPYLLDTDGDTFSDWYEIAIIDKNPALGSPPNTPNNTALKPTIPNPMPAYDGSFGATNKPVKVYILSGQSNMLGYGTVAGSGDGTLNKMVNSENKFTHLRNASGWVERNDVHVHAIIDAPANQFEKKKLRPDWQANHSNRFGPELGFGTIMGWYHDEPVLLIKPAIGNRALGWDYLPPGTPDYQPSPADGFIYAGFGKSGPGTPSASFNERWSVGNQAGLIGWYAGKQFDDYFRDEEDMAPRTWASGLSYPANCAVKASNGLPYISLNAHTSSAANEPGVGASFATNWKLYTVNNVVNILDEFATQYPAWAAQGFEISGYVWWQGHRDQSNGAVNSNRYRQNMERFIKQIRLYYENRYNNDMVGGSPNTLTKVIPNAPFVLSTVDAGGWDMTSHALTVANGQLAVDGNAKTGGVTNYPEFTGNVKTVEARGFYRPNGPSTTDGTHYFHNAEAYLLNGDALGRAMVELNSVTPTNTFTSWMAGYPNVPPALAGFDQDADGDGIENGVENFFGTNPSIGSAGLVSTATSSNTFVFTHRKNATPATGVIGVYRWSKNLSTFHADGANDGNGTTVSFNAVTAGNITTVTATVTGTATSKLFVDVRAIQN